MIRNSRCRIRRKPRNRRGLGWRVSGAGLFRLILLAALAWLMPSSVAAEAGRNAKADGTAPALLTIPFAPPLGRDILYDLTITKSRPDKPSQKADIRQSLRYERSGDGYVLEIRYLSIATGGTVIDLTSGKPDAAMPAEMITYFEPVSFDLDSEGSLVRVRNWDALKSRYATLPDRLVAGKTPEEAAFIRNGVETMLRSILQMSAEAAVNLVMKGWPSFLGFGGTELEDGVDYELESVLPASVLPFPIPVTIKSTLTRGEGGDLDYHQESAPKDDSVVANGLMDYLRKISASLPEARRKEMETQLDGMKSIRIEDVLDMRLATGTGLIREGRYQRTISLLGQQAIELTTVRQLP